MPKLLPLRDRLRQAGIRSYDELIHDQSKEWLIQHFREGTSDYPIGKTPSEAH